MILGRKNRLKLEVENKGTKALRQLSRQVKESESYPEETLVVYVDQFFVGIYDSERQTQRKRKSKQGY